MLQRNTRLWYNENARCSGDPSRKVSFSFVYKHSNITKASIYHPLKLNYCWNSKPRFSSKYLALASFDALTQYIGESKDFRLVHHSLQLEYSSLQNIVVMDFDTIKNLEILNNFRTGATKHSLFSILNYTKTQGGSRLLKTSLLYPTSDLSTLNGRLDAVEQFLNHEHPFYQVQKVEHH